MKVNSLSSGLQEELKKASDYNTERNENLFSNNTKPAQSFFDTDVEDLNIPPDAISDLLENFANEIINVFSSVMPAGEPEQSENSGDILGTSFVA
jgi:hypothetical protein